MPYQCTKPDRSDRSNLGASDTGHAMVESAPMFVIIASKGDRHWVSGVFESDAATHDYLAEIPQGERSNHAIQAACVTFPFTIIEDRNGFRCLSNVEGQHELKRTADDGAADDWLIFFDIVGEYRPKVPGRDEMGRLPHMHRWNKCRGLR